MRYGIRCLVLLTYFLNSWIFDSIYINNSMLLMQIFGFVLLMTASVSSSISMNFQKLAQYQTHYIDPRSRQRQRPTPLNTSVFVRPLFIVAMVLSAAASILDLLALAWLPTAVIGVFGSLSIIINLCVTQIILFERPTKEEYIAIAFVVIGCLLAITTTSEQMSPLTPPQLLERTGSCLFIVINWIVFIGSSVIMDNMTLPRWITRSGFPFIGGAILEILKRQSARIRALEIKIENIENKG